MGVSVVTKIGTVLYVLCTVVQGTITGGITSVTSEQGGEYVFQDGMGSFVTMVSKCDVRSSSEMGPGSGRGGVLITTIPHFERLSSLPNTAFFLINHPAPRLWRIPPLE